MKANWGREWIKVAVTSSAGALLMAIVCYLLAFYQFQKDTWPRDLLVSLGSSFVAIGSLNLLYEWFQQVKLFEYFTIMKDSERTGLKRIVENADEIKDELSEVIDKSYDKIRIMGISLTLFDENLVNKLVRKAKMGVDVEVIFLNPASKAAGIRLEEEERDKFLGGKTLIEDKIILFWNKRAGLSSEQERSKFKIYVSDNYPSIAVMIFDQRLYAYFYGYAVRGIHSPLLVFSSLNTPTAQHFVTHFDNVFNQKETPLGKLKEVDQAFIEPLRTSGRASS